MEKEIKQGISLTSSLFAAGADGQGEASSAQMSVPLRISLGPARAQTAAQQTKNPKPNAKPQGNPCEPGLWQQLHYPHCFSYCNFCTLLTVASGRLEMYKSIPKNKIWQMENINYILAEYQLGSGRV